MPRGTTTTARRSAAVRGLWTSVRGMFAGLEKSRLRKQALVASASLQTLAVALVIWLNVGGQPFGNGSVLGRDTAYLLGWTHSVNVNTTEGILYWPFTVYWFLNSVGIRNGTAGAITLLARTPGEDFDFTLVDSMFWDRYLPDNFHCDNSSGAFEPGADNAASVSVYLCARRPLRDSAPYMSARFGRDDFSTYVAAMVLATLAWVAHSSLSSSLDPMRARNSIMVVQLAATIMVLAASAQLTAGMNDVVAHNPDQDAILPTVSVFRNQTALAIVWCATSCQLLHCIAYGLAFWLWAKQNKNTVPVGSAAAAGGGGGGIGGRNNRSSLPMYRVRDGDELDILPPYQREDPLGQPPGIDVPHVAVRSTAVQGRSSCTADSGIGIEEGNVGDDDDSSRLAADPRDASSTAVEPASPLGTTNEIGELAHQAAASLTSATRSPPPPPPLLPPSLSEHAAAEEGRTSRAEQNTAGHD